MKVSQLDKPGLISTQIIDRQPLTLAAESTVADALVAMAQSGKNYVLILAAQTLVGILTERDVLRMVAQTQTWTNRRLKEVMTRSLVTYPAVSKPDVFEALKLLRQHQIRHLPVVDAKQQLTGLITYETLQSTLQPTALLRLRTVREVMNTAVLCATSNDSLLAIAAQMYTHKASCVVILESTAAATRCPVGIITERDIVQLQALGTDFAATPAHTAMSYPLLPIQAQDTLWQAHQAMTQHRVRRLVVRTDSDGLAGLITQTELLRSLDPLELYQNLQALETLVQQQTQSLNQLNTHLQQKVDAYQTLKQELEQANQELEQRVAERTAELEAANLLLCQQIQTLNPAVSPAQQPKLLSAAWIKFCLKEIPLPLPLATWLDRHPIYLGAGLTATTICLIEGLRQAGVMVPAPFLLIMVTAILTASTNGLWAGLASTGVWAIYVIWAALFSVGPPALSGGVAPVSLGILMVLLAGLRQGIERDRYQALNQLLISTNQSLDRQIQRHTATLQKTNQQLRQEVLERQQVETALRESETRFRVTFEKAAVGIVNTSPQGYFLKVNQKFCEILGY
ncbi:MAG: CBS domain-containing protein, partial [Almyronema sp.]